MASASPCIRLLNLPAQHALFSAMQLVDYLNGMWYMICRESAVGGRQRRDVRAVLRGLPWAMARSS